VWAVVSPDVRELVPKVKEGDRVFAAAAREGKLSPADTDCCFAQALSGLASSYAADHRPPPSA
jgi:hypothetical protein